MEWLTTNNMDDIWWHSQPIFFFPHLTLMWDNFTAFCGTESTRGGAGGTWPSLRGLFTDTGSVVERISSDESIPLSLSLSRYHPSSVKAHVKFWTNRRIILTVPFWGERGGPEQTDGEKKRRASPSWGKTSLRKHVKRKKPKDGGGVDFRRDQASQRLHWVSQQAGARLGTWIKVKISLTWGFGIIALDPLWKVSTL